MRTHAAMGMQAIYTHPLEGSPGMRPLPSSVLGLCALSNAGWKLWLHRWPGGMSCHWQMDKQCQMHYLGRSRTPGPAPAKHMSQSRDARIAWGRHGACWTGRRISCLHSVC